MSTGWFVAATAAFGPGGCGVTPAPGRSEEGRVSDEALAGALTMKGLRPLSRTARLAMVTAAHVWPTSSGSRTDASGRDATVLGSRWASATPLAEFVAVAAAEGPDRVFPMAFPNTVASVHAGYVATLLGLTGPVVSLCGAGAGLESALEALSLLDAGRADRVLVVAADAAEAPVALARPDAREASCALRLTREHEAGSPARVTGWWVAASEKQLPHRRTVEMPDVGDCGAAGGLLDLCAAVARVQRSGEPEVVVGACGVRGAAAVRLEPA